MYPPTTPQLSMLIPIGDEDRKAKRPPWITYFLLAANILVFVLLQEGGSNEAFTYGYSVVPQEITTGEDLTASETITVNGESVEIPHHSGPRPIFLTILTAMFLHGGWFHLFGNMLYLWIFGDNVEHRFGPLPFLAFYLLSGVAGTAVQVALDPSSIIPNLGASGAISGVLGAYLILFPKNRVYAVFFWYIIAIPAVVAIGIWIVFQLISGVGAVVAAEETVGGVAYGAHIGGFFAGLILALVMRSVIKKERSNFYTSYERRSR
ncbi:MAG: rhomboid family intramembrane serine protease [Rhodothermales bacterium]